MQRGELDAEEAALLIRAGGSPLTDLQAPSSLPLIVQRHLKAKWAMRLSLRSRDVTVSPYSGRVHETNGACAARLSFVLF